jgi:ubiquitin carboxyl-terminal hydrolase 4/11/15
MNSSLQCLNNAPGFIEYFEKDLFVNEINKSNPLGRKGAIADGMSALADCIFFF